MTATCPHCGKQIAQASQHVGGLTKQQQALLDFIVLRIRETQVAPTFDQMRTALGLKSKSGIARMLDALEERGRIRRLPARACAIELVGQGA